MAHIKKKTFKNRQDITGAVEVSYVPSPYPILFTPTDNKPLTGIILVVFIMFCYNHYI